MTPPSAPRNGPARRIESVVIDPSDELCVVHIMKNGDTYIQAHPDTDQKELARFLTELAERLRK